MINLNLIAQSLLTRIFVPKLITRKDRCAVISLSSCFSLHPFPLSQLYHSSKKYNDFLSVSLGLEAELNKNIDFLSVLPMFVETPGTKLKANGLVSTVSQCVNGSLNDLSYESKTYGCVSHKIQGYIVSLIPEFVIRNFSLMVFGKKVNDRHKELNGQNKKE